MQIFVVSAPAAEAELAADRLWSAGAGAVEEISRSDGTVELRTVLAGSDQMSLTRFGQVPTGWSTRVEQVDDAPNQTWRRFAEPIVVNESLVIRPAWRATTAGAGVIEVEIEPGASFGLGDHPTTRLSADAAWRLTSPGARVLDVGCGSGVLSVISALRGASSVTAIDISEAAREATVDNAARNDVADRIAASTTPVGEIDGSFDLVVANILAPILVSISDDLRRLTAPEGRLVLSGVLVGHHDHVIDALRPMAVVATSEHDGWAAVELEHG